MNWRDVRMPPALAALPRDPRCFPAPIEVHNVWTVYGVNEDGSEAAEPFAQASRPQDWGDPHWSYHRFRFDWHREDGHYINHVHCWTDLKRESHQYPELFASLIVMILMPGRPPQLCGREFLDEEDFWDSAWGPEPPVYYEAQEADIL